MVSSDPSLASRRITGLAPNNIVEIVDRQLADNFTGATTSRIVSLTTKVGYHRTQNWSRAFSRINGKSVDFLICTNDMKPLIAIELDDNTHDRPDRQKRDIFVNSIISDANMPLLRFKAGEWNSEIIKQEVTHALKESTLEKL